MECCICYSSKTDSQSGYEKLLKCVTEKDAQILQLCATQKDDNPRLLAYVAGVDWQTIVALELYYHRSCHRVYTRPNRARGGYIKLEMDAVDKIYSFIEEHVLQAGEIMHANEFVALYSAYCVKKDDVPDMRTLSDLILRHFGNKIDSWVPKYGASFIYSDSIPKGQIIEILTNKIKNAEERIKPPPIEEKINDVARCLRHEIKSTPLTYQDWPPDETTLLQNKTMNPPLLEYFMTSLISSTSRVSKRKERCISKCSTQACLFKTHGLKCTDLCGCGICENADNENDDCEQSDDDSDGSFASDSDSSAEMETTN